MKKIDESFSDIENLPENSEANIQQSEYDKLRTQLDAALVQAKENWEKFLRATADTENIRRRAQEDLSKAYKFSIESFARNILLVRDSLEMALKQNEQTIDGLKSGLESTLKQLTSVFEKNDLVEIAPNQGDKFDPNFHQAISSIESEYSHNTIIQLLQKGYKMHDRVLRAALVIVSSGLKSDGKIESTT